MENRQDKWKSIFLGDPSNQAAVKALSPFLTIHLFNLILGGLVIWGVAHSIHWPLIHDAPLMNFIARDILNGAVPYKDIFDMNMPGTYLIHMAVLQFLGKGSLSFRVFDIAWLFATGVALFYFSKPVSKWAGLFAAFAFSLFHIGLGPFSTGQRDYLMLLFIVLGSLFLSPSFDETRKTIPFLFVSGLCFGAAFLIKPFAILMPFLCVLPLLWKWKGSLRKLAWNSAAYSFGILCPILITGIWLFVIGALPDFLDILLNYLLPIYNKIYTQNTYDLLYQLFASNLLIPIVVLGILSVWHRSYKRPEILFAVIGVVYGVLHYVLQRRGSFYHVYPFAFFVILLGALLIAENLKKGLLYKVVASACAILLIVTLGSKMLDTVNQNATVAALKPSLIPLMEDIKSYHLAKGETVQVFDTVGGGIHALYLLNIQQPSRFIYDIQFLHNTDQAYIQKLQKELLSDLTSSPPKLIVLFDVGWHQSERKIKRLDSFPELIDLIDEDYSQAVNHNGYTIYVHK